MPWSLAAPAWPVLALWAALAGAASLSARAYLANIHAGELEATFRRAETTAEVAEQALLRSKQGLASVLDLVALHERLVNYGDGNGVLALDLHIKQLAAEGRFGVANAALAGLDGIVHWSTAPEALGMSVAGSDFFRSAIAGAPGPFAVGAPRISRVNGRWMMGIARLLRDPWDGPTSIAIVTVNPLALSQELATIAPSQRHSLMIRRLEDGVTRASNIAPVERFGRDPQPDHPVLRAARQAPQGRLIFNTLSSGREVVAAYRLQPDASLVVSASFDLKAEMAGYRQIAMPVVAATALYILSSLAIAAIWWRNARLRRDLRILATIDPLTGLDNRRSLEARLDKRLARRGGERAGFACLLFDLDHFKRINDEHGHATGDAVLRDVASLLRARVRDDDIVCRWGGEEILVALWGCGEEQALRRAEELREAIADLYGQGSVPARITASIGVACYPEAGENLHRLADAADEALYRAKRAGRNRVEAAAAV